jgi:hypothetical protein
MKSSRTGQKGTQHAGVTANVDDDEKRRRAPGRQRRNKATQSLKATGGTCDYHDCVHDSWAGQRVRHNPLDLVETNLIAPAMRMSLPVLRDSHSERSGRVLVSK